MRILATNILTRLENVLAEGVGGKGRFQMKRKSAGLEERTYFAFGTWPFIPLFWALVNSKRRVAFTN